MSISIKDTIVVSARKQSFENLFMDEKAWYPISISKQMRDKIKYIATYETTPISAITHYAKVEKIEEISPRGKCRVIFSKPKQLSRSIPLDPSPAGTIQGIRYTTFKKLSEAKSVSELF